MEADDLKALIDERCRGCAANVDYRFDAANQALRIQTHELERRLDLLNGEAERLRRMQETYVSQDVYALAHERMRDEIKALQDFKSNMQGRYTVIAVAVSAAISVGILLLNYIMFGVR